MDQWLYIQLEFYEPPSEVQNRFVKLNVLFSLETFFFFQVYKYVSVRLK
jgi:hypothetical protein